MIVLGLLVDTQDEPKTKNLAEKNILSKVENDPLYADKLKGSMYGCFACKRNKHCGKNCLTLCMPVSCVSEGSSRHSMDHKQQTPEDICSNLR